MKVARSLRLLGLGVVLAGACVTSAATAAPPSGLPNAHRVTALYVIDHQGADPRGDLDLVAYSNPFEKILGGCTIRPDPLTMLAINLADKASALGARRVSALMMLRAIARRVNWSAPKNCQTIYNLAEARAENGDP